MKTRLFLLLLTGGLFCACSKDAVHTTTVELQSPNCTILSPEEAERFVLLNTDYAVSKEDILKQAEAVAKILDKTGTKTRAEFRKPVISDSIVPTNTTTKNNEGIIPPKIYVATFGKDAGFALFAGDKRVNEALAFSGEGNFQANDLHPAMEYFIECLQMYTLSEIERMGTMRGDSIYNRLLHRYGMFGDRCSDVQTKYPVWNGIEYVDMPVDNVTQEWHENGGETIFQKLLVKSNWNQNWPYNRKIMASYGDGIPTGCVATAVAQIMNYHKTGTYNGKTYTWNQYPAKDWSNVSPDVLNSIGDLFLDLGKPENLNMSYTINGSSASIKDVPRTLNHFGYTSTKTKDYSTTALLDDLNNNRPVYMRGEDVTNDVAHAWVVGGVSLTETYTIYRVNYLV